MSPLKPIAKGAVLTLEGYQDLHEKPVTIRHSVLPDGSGVFALFCEGVLLATSTHPFPLRKYADANGAISIRHDYDLGLIDD